MERERITHRYLLTDIFLKLIGYNFNSLIHIFEAGASKKLIDP